MANRVLATKIQITRGTSTQWASSTRVLLSGELGLETDTNRVKIGDGVNVYSALPYLTVEFSEKIGDGTTSLTLSQINSAINEKLNASAISAWALASTRPKYAYGNSDLTGFGTAAAKNTGTTSGTIPLLDSSGKLPTTVIPPLAISETFTVASQSAMLALTAQRGDVAIRTDEAKTYILTVDGGAGTLANWKQILTPAAPVQTVNGKTGAVSLSYSDVGADASGAASAVNNSLTTHTTNTSNPHGVTKSQVGLGNCDNTSDANKPISTATQTALNAKVPTSRTVNGKALSGNVSLAAADLSDGTKVLLSDDSYIFDGGAL